MLAICSADKSVAFKAPKPSFNVERVPQGTKPGAKHGHKKHSTSSKQPSVSSKEATKIQRISLTGFPAQSVGSSNTDVLESPCLLVLITGTSQSRQHGKSESDSYYLSDLVVNSFTGPKSISS
ncbi:hypothetical protein Tco_0162876 [Tanacetum coccineum]